MVEEVREDLENVKFPIKKIQSYVNINGKPYPAGYAIVDMRKPEVIKTVSDNFKLITNEELVDFISHKQRVKFKRIYTTQARDTFYINGYFPDMFVKDFKGNIVFLGFEIANSYSSRFLAHINISLYLHKFNTLVKTPLRLCEFSRENFGSDIEFIPENVAKAFSIVIDKPCKLDYYDVRTLLPAKYKQQYSEVIVKPFKEFFSQTNWGLILSIAQICTVWEGNSYELARAFIHKMWDNINK